MTKIEKMERAKQSLFWTILVQEIIGMQFCHPRLFETYIFWPSNQQSIVPSGRVAFLRDEDEHKKKACPGSGSNEC